MTRLETLCAAIQKEEGWFPFSRAWRNNNPGNLTVSPFACGSDGRFARFTSFTAGWLGLWWDLFNKCRGNTRTGLGPNSNLGQLVGVWAPASDGNWPARYAQDVASFVGCQIGTPLKWFLEDIT